MGNSQDNKDYVSVAELSQSISIRFQIDQNDTIKQQLLKFQCVAKEFLEDSTKILQKNKSIIVLGKTGTCKSTLIELLSYKSLQRVEVNGITQIQGSERIGNFSFSHTQQLFEQEAIKDLYLIDTPGIDDTRGELQDIKNSLLIQKAINTSQNVKILYCITYDDTKSKQSELQRVVGDLIRLNIIFENSLGIIITKAPTKKPHYQEYQKVLEQSKTRIIQMLTEMNLEHQLQERLIDAFENKTVLFNDPLELDSETVFQQNRQQINNLINDLKYTNQIQGKNYLLLSSNTKIFYFKLIDEMIQQIQLILEDVQHKLIQHIVQTSDKKFISAKSKKVVEDLSEIIPDKIQVKNLCQVILNIIQLYKRNKIDLDLQQEKCEFLNFYNFIVGQVLVDYQDLNKFVNLFPLKKQIMIALHKCQRVIDRMERDNIIYIEEENRAVVRRKKLTNQIIYCTPILPFSIGGAVLGPIGLLVGFLCGVSVAFSIKYFDNRVVQEQNNQQNN